MSITGFPDGEGGGPTKVGVAIADVTTGLLGGVAILAALEGRGRPGSPAFEKGQRIDLSILESTLAVLVNQAQNAFATGSSPDRLGNAHPNIVPYETFATSDGQIALATGSERQWARLCAALELDALADDPRFNANGHRVANRAELRPILAERFAARPTSTWLVAPGRGRDPLRCDPGRPRGVRVRAGSRPGDDCRGRAPSARPAPPGRAAVQAGGHARPRFEPRRPCSASTRPRSWPSWANAGRDHPPARPPGHDVPTCTVGPRRTNPVLDLQPGHARSEPAT